LEVHQHFINNLCAMDQEMSPKNVVRYVRNAHDKSFRNAMRNPVVARDMLSHHLPVEILQQIDLETLQIEDGVFISRTVVTVTDA